MRVQFRQVSGLQTRILYEGTGGKPVLLVHGLGTTAERWVKNIDPLAERFTVYAPDLPGAGFSQDAEFTRAPPLQHLAHLRQLIETLGINRFSVIGSSYGALLAALLAIQFPERVCALVIVGSGSALHPPDEQRAVLTAARDNAMKALADGTLAGTRARMERIVFNPASVPELSLMVQLTANALPGRIRTSEQLYDAMLTALAIPDAQVHHRLEDIRVPTLIITGRNDIRASWEWAEKAQRRIRDCRLEIFDECGHGPMFEHPERFNRVVTEFLETKRGGTE